MISGGRDETLSSSAQHCRFQSNPHISLLRREPNSDLYRVRLVSKQVIHLWTLLIEYFKIHSSENFHIVTCKQYKKKLGRTHFSLFPCNSFCTVYLARLSSLSSSSYTYLTYLSIQPLPRCDIISL